MATEVAILFMSSAPRLPGLIFVFVLAGIYISAQDVLEGAIPAGMVSKQSRGLAYGALGTVNGLGDLVASVLVGTLWTAVSPAAAFRCASTLMLVGVVSVALCLVGEKKDATPGKRR